MKKCQQIEKMYL